MTFAFDARRERVTDVGQRRARRLAIGGGDGQQAQAGADRRRLRARHAGAHALAARLGRKFDHPRDAPPARLA